MLALAALIAFPFAPATAQQNGEKNDSAGADAVDAVSQPLSDLNLRNKEIPTVLLRAQAGPYDLAAVENCTALRGEIGELDAVLGPDADTPAEAEGLVNKGLKLGGNILGGFIPFRGLVRQLSGANAERARWEAAIYAGVARRSYLKGYAKALNCPTEAEAIVQSAEDVLGLSGR